MPEDLPTPEKSLKQLEKESKKKINKTVKNEIGENFFDRFSLILHLYYITKIH